MRSILWLLSAVILVAGCQSSSPCDAKGMTMNGAACVSTDDCCWNYEMSMKDPAALLTCSRYGRACRPGSDLPLGETCAASVQCASRNCDGNYCTVQCNTDAACDSMTSCTHPYYYDSGWFCRPTCQTDDDCVVYGPSRAVRGKRFVCKKTKTIDGEDASVCSPRET